MREYIELTRDISQREIAVHTAYTLKHSLRVASLATLASETSVSGNTKLTSAISARVNLR